MVRAILILSLPAAAERAGRKAAAEPRLNRDFQAYVNAYFLAEAKIDEFDAELDAALANPKARFLARSERYRELTALRRLVEGRTHEIAEAYLRLLDPPGREQDDAARAELDAFHARLRSLDPAERLAASDLLREVRELAGKRLESTRLELPVFFASLAQELTAREASAASIAAHVREAQRDPELKRAVQSLLASSDLSFLVEEPKPPVLQPSPGPDGNVTGYTFPDNTWALTLDDGPSDKYTPGMVENLQKYGKKASFFWLVENLVQFPDVVTRVRSLAFPTNNHSYTHADLSKAKANLNYEIVQSTEKETEIYGEKPRFFRLPFGAGLSKQPVRQVIANQGMIHVFWNVDSLDWKDKRPAHILARVKKQMGLEKHGIILFHDIHPQSVEAVKLLLQYSATLDGTPKQHRWVTLPEIVDELNANPRP